MRAAFELLGDRPSGLRLSCHNVIPHARGLGSSSAAIVAGVVLARGLVAGGSLLVDDDALFRLAARLEGHPDNVAPAFHGGFTISGHEGDFYTVGSPVDPRVETVVFVPPTPVSTEVARGCCPTPYPMRTRPRTPDGRRCWWPRSPAGPSSCGARPATTSTRTTDGPRCRSRSRSSTRCVPTGSPAIVSGAGPTVLAFTDRAGVDTLRAHGPAGWAVHHLLVDQVGARLA